MGKNLQLKTKSAFPKTLKKQTETIWNAVEGFF